MVTEMVHQSWLSRLGKSAVAVLFGFLLFAIGIVLLGWNEGRAVKIAKGLREGAEIVVNLKKPDLNPVNTGFLIHTTGKVMTQNVLRDPVFNVAENAIKLRRTVEMYQWKENSKEETKTNLGGSTDTVKTYTYEKVWSENRIKSSDFHDSGHKNPSQLPFQTSTWTAKDVALGDFVLNEELVEQMDRFEGVPLPAILPQGFVAQGDQAYKGKPDSPEVGDLRVKFEEVKMAEVSIVAGQEGKDLVAYTTRTKTTLNMLVYGRVSAAQMFDDALKANVILTWALRALGFFLLFIGGVLVASPIGVLADVIPFLGGVARFGTSLLALIVAISLGSLTIALAWLAYRPLLGITVLVLGIGIPVWLLMRKKKALSAAPAG